MLEEVDTPTDETVRTKVPPKAKKPQDRKPKTPEDGARLVSARGRQWSIPTDALDDFELLDDLAALEGGNAGRLASVLRRLIGPDQFREAMGVLRDSGNGRVRLEAGGEFVRELMEGIAPNS